MPGTNCCMPGCSVSSLRCSTLKTFHGIPNGKADAEWRAALIHKINRADTLFNPKNARICSRHFEETCFKYGKRALIPGSLPTNHVLQKSVETPKTPARKPPVSRPPPPAPDLVAYYNFEEIRQDTLQLAAPWCLLENSKEQIQVGITEASQVKLLSSTL
ncbi:uncharacterized protein [Littorina saxatilis]|uniref:uncharacterized protein isoform X1 n=1 Tax=Littorina saxatilis TaxID=31220 RepID=UPI0038B444C6